MENRSYFICSIAEGSNDICGRFIYVEGMPADGRPPLNPNGNTDVFYLPEDTDVDYLVSLANQNRVWTPNVSDFGFRYVPNRQKMTNVLTHIHKSLLDMENDY